jgi:hypothetical protein
LEAPATDKNGGRVKVESGTGICQRVCLRVNIFDREHFEASGAKAD